MGEFTPNELKHRGDGIRVLALTENVPPGLGTDACIPKTVSRLSQREGFTYNCRQEHAVVALGDKHRAEQGARCGACLTFPSQPSPPAGVHSGLHTLG